MAIVFRSDNKSIVAMIHVAALPGTPRHAESIDTIVERAANEARLLADAGVDALLIENMHDVPYLRAAVGPEIVAAMTAVGVAVRAAAPLPLGVQVLAAANEEALAVALACGADFIRVENFAYAHVADEGLMPKAAAGPLLRYRRQIGAEHVRILADVKKKHAAHALTADLSIAEAARAAAFFGADAVVVTGIGTAQPTDPDDLAAVCDAVDVPVCVGSGIDADRLPALWPRASVFIVGSALKRDGLWSNPPDPERIARFMDAVAGLRA